MVVLRASVMQLRRCLVTLPTKPSRPGKFSVNACLRCGQILVSRADARQLKASATQAPREEAGAAQEALQQREAEPAEREAAGNEAERSLGVRVALALLSFYKNGISPLLPPSCRYLPTCSSYAMEAYQAYGVGKGTILTAWRLMRCSPFGSSGYDPVKWPPVGLEWIIKA